TGDACDFASAAASVVRKLSTQRRMARRETPVIQCEASRRQTIMEAAEPVSKDAVLHNAQSNKPRQAEARVARHAALSANMSCAFKRRATRERDPCKTEQCPNPSTINLLRAPHSVQLPRVATSVG